MKKLSIRQVYIIISLGLLSTSFSFIWGQISPIINMSTDFSPERITQMVSVILIVSGFSQVFVGKKFDENGGHFVIIFSFLFYASGVLLLVMSENKNVFTVLGAGIATIGLSGLYTTHTRLTKLATDVCLLDKIGHDDYIAVNIGHSIAAVAAFFFLKGHLKTLIVLDLLTTFCATLGYLYYYHIMSLKQKNDKRPSKSDRRSKINYMKIWKKIVGMGILAGILLFHIVLVPNIYSTLGYEPITFQAITFFVNAIVVLFLGSYLRLKLEMYSPYNRFLLGTVLLGVGFFSIYFIQGVKSLIFVTTIWTLGEILSVGPYSHYFFYDFTPETKGEAAGLLTFLFGIGGGLVPLLLSPILSISPFWVCFLCGPLPFIAFILLTSKDSLVRRS